MIKTNPDNIEVWLDDTYIGQTPVIAKHLKSGHYTIKLVDPIRHSSYTEEIQIRENDTTNIEKTIESKFGVLTVKSEPEDAHVVISSELGKTPLSNEFMSPGKYSIEIRHVNPKYQPTIEEVLITQGKTVTVTKILERDKLLNRKAKLRLILGAGSVAGFVFAMIENGMHEKYEERISNSYNINSEMIKKRDTCNLLRILGLAGGALCLTSLEIVSFF